MLMAEWPWLLLLRRLVECYDCRLRFRVPLSGLTRHEANCEPALEPDVDVPNEPRVASEPPHVASMCRLAFRH